MAIKVNGINVINDNRKGEFRGANPGRFTTTERDGLSPSIGDMVFNTTDGELQIWDGAEWGSAGGAGSGLAPAVTSVNLAENETGDPRFTDQTFTSTVDMFQEGQPVSTKSIKAKVVAEFPVYPETNPIDSVTINTTSSVLNNTVLQSTNNPACVFNYVNPDSQRLECFSLRIQDNSTVMLAKATDLKATSFNNVGNPAIGSPYSDKACIAYTTPDEKYVLIQQASQGQGIYVEAANFINGSYNVAYNYQVEVGKYKLRIGSGGSFGVNIELYEKVPAGTFTSRGIKTLPGYGTWNWTQATVVGDSVVITTNQSSANNSIYICNVTQEYLDNWQSGGQIPVNDSVTISAYRKQCEHKGKLFISSQSGLIVYSLDTNSTSTLSKPPTPSSFNYAGDAIFEDPYGFLIMKMAWSAGSVITYQYFKSNNAGVTWNTSPEYPDLPTGSGNGPNESRQATDCYQYGYRLAIWVSADTQTSYRRYSMGYQEVTIANSPDLSSINVGDLLRPSGVSNPRNYMLVDQITILGDGNTKLKLTGFTTLTQGQLLTTTASTGRSQLTKWLVISESSGLITDMTENEPAFVDIGPSTTVPITFPATFPSNKTPDEELPIGTTLQTYVKTVNAAGDSQGISNVFLPTEVAIPDDLSLNLTSRTFAAGVGTDIQWYSDSGGVLTSISDAAADATWKSQQYWINESGGSGGSPKGFQAGTDAAGIGGSDRQFTLNFDCIGLKNKVVNFQLVGLSSDNGEMSAKITTSTTGAAPYKSGYGGQMGYWQYNPQGGNTQTSINQPMEILISEDISTLEVTIAFSGPGSSDGHFLSIPWYRVTDLDGNELPFYPAVTQD